MNYSISNIKLKAGLTFVWKYKMNFLLLIIISILGSSISYINPYLNMLIFDIGIGKKKIKLFLISVAGICIVYVIQNVFSIIKSLYSKKINYKMEKALKNSVLNYVLFTSKKLKEGEINALFSHDVNVFLTLINSVGQELFTDIAGIILAACFLIKINFKMAVLVMFLEATILMIRLKSNEILSKKSEKTRNSFIDIAGVENEIILNYKSICSLGAEKYFVSRYNRVLEANFREEYEKNKFYNYLGAGISILSNGISSTILLFGGLGVIRGQMTIGQLVSFFQYTSMFISSLTSLTGIPSELSANVASIKNVLEVLGIESERNVAEEKALRKIHQIEIKNLTFSYTDKNLIFKNLNVIFKKNTINYIIGKSGIGKTTLANLLLKRIDTKENYIWFDKEELNSFEKRQLAKYISWVSQDSIIFNDTIWNNITLGEPADIDEIIPICKESMIWEDIQAMEDGLNTVIHGFGDNLSGGQINRICLARAIFMEKPIIIIDEGTSGVDTATERKLKINLNSFFKDRIVIIITHSENFISETGNIYEIKNHRIYLKNRSDNI
ncbi:MAG: ABC transporter ATP-binding protein [Eubacterium sp.]|nr:ABC transporter ATP-binding protein [Eubacterium sp.]